MGAQGNMNVRVFGNVGANAKKTRMPCDSGDLALTLASQHPIIWLQQYLVLARVCHMIAVLYMHSLKMTGPAIIAQKVANVAIKTTKLWTWTQSHLETMLGHNGVLLTRFVSTNRKRQFETMWCHQHQTWMGSPVHGHFDGKIVEHVELNEGCPQQNTLYYFIIFQSRFQFFGENIGKRNLQLLKWETWNSCE